MKAMQARSSVQKSRQQTSDSYFIDRSKAMMIGQPKL
jgi:hypothetical protein